MFGSGRLCADDNKTTNADYTIVAEDCSDVARIREADKQNQERLGEAIDNFPRLMLKMQCKR